MDSQEILELAIRKAAEEFDDWQDCTCADGDYACWYHLTDDQQMDLRVESVASRLQVSEGTVREVLNSR